MLSKTVEHYSQDWDRHFSYVLYAYRVSVQEATKESPFFLLYGRGPALPMLDALSCECTPYMMDVDDYKAKLCSGLNSAWKLAQPNIENAQYHQKSSYDRHAMERSLMVGQRVMMVCMPTEIQGKTLKFGWRFLHGSFHILSLTPTNAEVQLVDELQSKSMFVSYNRVRTCYEELPDILWKGSSPHKFTPTLLAVRSVKAGTNAGQGGAVP